MDNTAPQRTGNETIMAVDDTPANLAILVELLGRRGYRVAAFPRGSMALKAAALEAPDLILLDIMMPGMDGFEICMRLKEDEKLREIPVLFILPWTDPAGRYGLSRPEEWDYVTKPFQVEELAARSGPTSTSAHAEGTERHQPLSRGPGPGKGQEISIPACNYSRHSRLAESLDDVTESASSGAVILQADALCLRRITGSGDRHRRIRGEHFTTPLPA